MAHYEVGQIIFDVSITSAAREQIAQFSEGTEDPNPIHVDEAFAKEAGFPSVIQQGPLTTAHLTRLLAEAVGQDKMRWFDITFTAPVFPEEELRLQAVVTRVENGMATCELTAEKADGTRTATAQAEFEG